MEEEIKIGARNNAKDRERLQQIHDFAVENGAECAPEVAEIAVMSVTTNALKTISRSDNELRVGNYIAVFGGKDLTGHYVGLVDRRRGSSGEYFTPNTDFESKHTKAGTIPVDFEHGFDLDELGIDEHDVLGFVDWKTAYKDEKGLFVERVLNRRNQYVQWLEELIDAGLIGNSSMAIGPVDKAADGEIKTFPLARDTLTVQPAEPRMLSQNIIAVIKSASEQMPFLKSLLPLPQGDGVLPEAGDEQPTNQPIQEIRGDTMEFTQEQIEAMVSSAAKSAVEEYAKSQPATIKAAANVEVIKDEADNPFGSAGEFLMAVKNAALYPNRADVKLTSRSLKATGLSEGVPADGGYLVDTTMASGIYDRMYNTGEILKRVDNYQIGPNSNGMTFNAVDETSRVAGSRWGGVLGYWMAEAATKTASKPKFRQVELKLKKVAALCYATDELLQDAVALEGWLNRVVPEELKFMVEDAYFEGDGVGKPLGIMSSTALVTVTRDTGGSIVAADVVNMWARRWPGVSDYVWLVSPGAYAELPQMTISTYPAFMPAGGLAATQYGTLFGRPVIETEYSAALNTTGDIMLASLSQYRTITKGGVQAASSMHVQFLTDEMVYRWVYRTDGVSMWSSALTPFKGSDTLSPFVVLGSAT